MATFELSTFDLQHLEVSEVEAQTLVDDFTAELRHLTPCLFAGDLDPDVIAYAKALVRGAVARSVDMRRDRVTRAAGRQSVTYTPAAAPAYSAERFTEAERSSLAGLCGAAASAGAVPLGRFPKAPQWPWC